MLLTGCAHLPPTEQQALVRASESYAGGDSAAAAVTLERLIRDYPSTKEIAEAYYVRGLCRVRDSRLDQAAADFEAGLAKSQRPDLTARCQASLAAIAYGKGEWPRAAELYLAAAQALPDEPPTDDVLFDAAVSLQRAGKWQEAAYQLGRILRKFRDRPVAAQARQLAGWRHEYFAIQLEACAGPEQAATAAEVARRAGLQAEEETVVRGGIPVWVVIVGRYPTYGEAVEALKALPQTHPGALIIP